MLPSLLKACLTAIVSGTHQWQSKISANSTFEPAAFLFDCVEAEFGKFVPEGFIGHFLVFEHWKKKKEHQMVYIDA